MSAVMSPMIKVFIHKSVLSLIFCLSTSVLVGCMSQYEVVLSKSPEEIQEWSDKQLCQNALFPNKSIKAELLKRKLLDEA